MAEIRKQISSRIGRTWQGYLRKRDLRRLVPNGDLAYEWGRSSAQFKDKSISGRFVTIWKNQAAGSWKIIRNMSLPERPK